MKNYQNKNKNGRPLKRRRLSRVIETDNDEMYVSTKSPCFRDEEMMDDEIPKMIPEEREEVPTLALESNNSFDRSITSSEIKPTIMKPKQHIRGKDLNQLINQYHNSHSQKHSLMKRESSFGEMEQKQPVSERIIQMKVKQAQSPPTIRPKQHFRGKDLNRLLQRYHETRTEETASFQESSPTTTDQLFPFAQGIESCMGRQFYPIDEEEDKSDYSSSYLY
eukprot:CAMPEP_0178923848 /NCGR_PEP_ID=MMETSP0786-20121207/16988_1 /TAXON_ID=186022 /ORGANISM="Thalassionema frauenfeldii, Strain CCMP 1798" /LENGTH=220 /DNA_ID=CAMNT_0020598471 /DNA_START=279 /DNA_END=941 /DNA_ORIENTATION=-